MEEYTAEFAATEPLDLSTTKKQAREDKHAAGVDFSI